jgi:hypothetical protein
MTHVLFARDAVVEGAGEAAHGAVTAVDLLSPIFPRG